MIIQYNTIICLILSLSLYIYSASSLTLFLSLFFSLTLTLTLFASLCLCPPFSHYSSFPHITSAHPLFLSSSSQHILSPKVERINVLCIISLDRDAKKLGEMEGGGPVNIANDCVVQS